MKDDVRVGIYTVKWLSIAGLGMKVSLSIIHTHNLAVGNNPTKFTGITIILWIVIVAICFAQEMERTFKE